MLLVISRSHFDIYPLENHAHHFTGFPCSVTFNVLHVLIVILLVLAFRYSELERHDQSSSVIISRPIGSACIPVLKRAFKLLRLFSAHEYLGESYLALP